MLNKCLQRLNTNFDIESYRNISTVTHKGHKTNKQPIPCINIVRFWQNQFPGGNLLVGTAHLQQSLWV